MKWSKTGDTLLSLHTDNTNTQTNLFSGSCCVWRTVGVSLSSKPCVLPFSSRSVRLFGAERRLESVSVGSTLKASCAASQSKSKDEILTRCLNKEIEKHNFWSVVARIWSITQK